jgi:hypothetical protein
VAGCCECGDEPSGSCATELVSYFYVQNFTFYCCFMYKQKENEKVDFVKYFKNCVAHILTIFLYKGSSLCDISGSRGGEHEVYSLLGCIAV